ncbi:MAG: hypothetical protein MnENMB40S_15440 [Rhizobiaceae bacterium MnEN-MB40S]|nr:MAG: hypothetical protein MnENMB40S_15440 [Rhizobiaceae bacterium MnEN-MB40S]
MVLKLDRRRFIGTALGGTAALAMSNRFASAQTYDVSIAYGSDGYTWSVPYVADGIGAWANHGLNVTAATFASGRESLESALTEDSDFGTSTDSPYLFAALRGLKPIVFANYQRYSKDMKIVMRTERGAVQDDPSSLKGKSIATRIGTSGHYMLHRYLDMAGLTKDDVTVVNMTPGDAINAVVRGDVDGISWTSRAAFVVQDAIKDDAFIMTQDGLEEFFSSHQLMCTNTSIVSERPEILKPGVAALLEAEKFIAEDLKWSEIVAERTKTTPDAVISETVDFEFALRFDDKFLEDLVKAAEWAIAENLVKAPDKPLKDIFLETFYTEALEELAPDRVTLSA